MIVWIWLVENYDAIRWGVAGFFGALVASYVRREDLKKRRDYIFFACTGAITAHFLTGAIATYLEVSAPNAASIGFLLGLFGGPLIQAVIKGIKSADPWQFIMSRWGGK